MMLLLVSTLVLLVNPALTNPLHQQKSPNNLNHIFDLAENYNKSLAQVRTHLMRNTVLLLVDLLLHYLVKIFNVSRKLPKVLNYLFSSGFLCGGCVTSG